MQLSFKIRKGTLIVSLKGEFDHSVANEVKTGIEQEMALSRVKNLVFDMSELEFMDSSGIGVIVGRYKAVTAVGGKIAIAAPNSQVTRILNISGIHRIIPVWGSVDAALTGM